MSPIKDLVVSSHLTIGAIDRAIKGEIPHELAKRYAIALVRTARRAVEEAITRYIGDGMRFDWYAFWDATDIVSVPNNRKQNWSDMARIKTALNLEDAINALIERELS